MMRYTAKSIKQLFKMKQVIDKVHFSAFTNNPAKVRQLLKHYKKDLESGQETYTSKPCKKGNKPAIWLTGNRFNWRGSIHKSYNHRINGLSENLTPYSHHEFVSQFQVIADTYDLDLNTVRFTHVEVGFNLQLRRESHAYISSATYYRGSNGRRYLLSKTAKEDEWLSFKHRGHRFELVGYGKARDSNLPAAAKPEADNVVRIELRLKRGAAYFPSSYADLADIHKYSLLTAELRTAVSKVEFYPLPWQISDFGQYKGGSAQKRLAHLLLYFAKGREEELIHLIETTTPERGKSNDLKKAWRDVLASRPVDIPDICVDTEILISLDTMIADFLGEQYIFRYANYGLPQPEENEL